MARITKPHRRRLGREREAEKALTRFVFTQLRVSHQPTRSQYSEAAVLPAGKSL